MDVTAPVYCCRLLHASHAEGGWFSCFAMVLGPVGIVLTCTLTDHIGLECASRRRRGLVNLSTGILVLSFVFSLTALVLCGFGLRDETIDLVPLVHVKTYPLRPDGGALTQLPETTWTGIKFNLATACLTTGNLTGSPSHFHYDDSSKECLSLGGMIEGGFDDFERQFQIWADPDTMRLCALPAQTW